MNYGDSTSTDALFDAIARGFDMSETGVEYATRHGVRALSRLTVTTDEVAALITERLADRIGGRTIVEIGAGSGLLSLHMATVARRVFAIEANPIWGSTFVELLLERKPRHLSYLMGSASEFYGGIRADVAVFATHSDVRGLTAVARQFAPCVIDIYGEMIEENPGAFDPVAREARRTG